MALDSVSSELVLADEELNGAFGVVGGGGRTCRIKGARDDTRDDGDICCSTGVS